MYVCMYVCMYVHNYSNNTGSYPAKYLHIVLNVIKHPMSATESTFRYCLLLIWKLITSHTTSEGVAIYQLYMCGIRSVCCMPISYLIVNN